MAAIEMKNIVKQYGDGFPAVNDVSIDVEDGELMILVGPSGCGKSTLLRMIVGLEDITSGDMLIGGSTTWRPATATCPWCSRTTRSIRT
jgi:multiple sugar transport system ATP-binding protein